MSDELTTLTFRLPVTLREKLKATASEQERTESGYLRYLLGRELNMAEGDCQCDDAPPSPAPVVATSNACLSGASK